MKGEMEVENNENMLQNGSNFFLIIVIVNKGFSDLVMEAARKVGARGGTILNARGTGKKEIEKHYGIVIHPDKELVLIVSKEDTKNNIMKEIYNECGLDSKAQGIIFSLKVDDVKGMSDELRNIVD